jgi:hypothetical protein
MTPTPRLPLAALLGLLALSACSRSPDKVTLDFRRASQGTPVATFSGGVITAEELSKALAQMPPMVRMRYQSPAQKKELVERMVRIDLLARDSVARGHANDADVLEAVKNVLAQKALKDELEAKAPTVTDEEVQAWYEAHLADYARPASWRLSTLFLAVPEQDEAKKKAQTAKAEKLLAQARKLKADDFAGFGQLVKANSEDASKAAEGDVGALPLSQLTNRFGPEVAQAVEALKTPGELTGVLAGRNGLYIFKLRALTPASQSSLADVKGQIRSRLQNERRSQASEKFLAELASKANLKVDEAALAKVQVEMPARPDQAPVPRAVLPAPAPAPTPPASKP